MAIKVTVDSLFLKKTVWPIKYSRESILEKEKSKSVKLRLTFTTSLQPFLYFAGTAVVLTIYTYWIVKQSSNGQEFCLTQILNLFDHEVLSKKL